MMWYNNNIESLTIGIQFLLVEENSGIPPKWLADCIGRDNRWLPIIKILWWYQGFNEVEKLLTNAARKGDFYIQLCLPWF